MTEKPVNGARSIHDRIHAEMIDSFDEELELEIDDERLDALTNEFEGHTSEETVDRRLYFKELFRLQGELVKLQSWVQHQKLKVVVIFEGRDSAGKGGVIKRITQRLNPRVCRVAALPAPNERERTQWYFQRYASHLPAGGEMVLFDRSWYNRAGVERVMGFCTEADVEEFFRSVPEFERMLVRSGIILIKYWFSITDEEHADPRSAEAVEAEPDGRAGAKPLGTIHQGQGSDAGAHPYRGSAVARGPGRRQEEGAAELHRPSSGADSLPGCRARSCHSAGARAQPGLPPRPGPAGTLCARAVLGRALITYLRAPIARGSGHPDLPSASLLCVESRCDAVALGSNISVSAPFVRRCLTGSTITPFSHPAHRTGQADFPHPALGQNFTPSPTARRAQACSGVRA